jgi:nitrite reductase (NADH) large subunit
VAPPIPGLGFANVRAFRDIADVDAMVGAAKAGGRAVVIGGGLLGLEAAWGLKRRGMAVTLVHLMPTLMERQLDATAGALLLRDLETRGIDFFVGAQTEEIAASEERAEAVVLADGRRLPADFVVLAIGVRPNIDLAKAAKLDANRGVLVGDDMATSDPLIHAVGECIEHNGQVFGLVAPIWEQTRVCGARLAGDSGAVYVPPPVFTSLKITGIDVFSAGALAAADDCEEEITLHDAKGGLYKKVILRDDRIIGSVLYGDATDGPWHVELMRNKTDVAPIRDQIVFGRDYAEKALAACAAEIRMSDADTDAAAALRWKAA